jgi:hypothetical protein
VSPRLICAAGLVVVLGFAGAGRAGADPEDLAAVNQYFYSLSIAGVHVEGSRPMLLQAGFTVCDDLRAGYGERSEEVNLMGKGYGPDTAAAIINAAEVNLCTGEERLPTQ